MKLLKAMAVMVVVAGFATASSSFAQDGSSETVVTGQNICLGCSLKKEQGAGAQCSIYGHKHSLRVTSAIVSGKEAPKMKGWVLHYLETKKSEDAIKKHHGQSLTIVGRVYADERVLEVLSLKSDKE